jgi:hypothetical protein
VLAVPVNQRVFPAAGGFVSELRADAAVASLPAQAWKRLSAGPGAQGPRIYHLARVLIRPMNEAGTRHWLLFRRSLSDPTNLAYYLCFGRADTPLRELVRVAGARWAIEESFQSAKARSAWTSTRSVATTPGTGTSPWPCWPMRS